MNTGPDQTDPNAPLSAEERALAERLAQVAPQGEPSGALDARILAAARAATTANGAAGRGTRSRTRRRWPAVTAVAATLVLAAGIGWQLRPVDDLQVEYSEAPRAAMPAAAVTEASPSADEELAQGEQATPPPAEKPAAAGESGPGVAESAANMADRARPEAEPPPVPPEPPVVFDQPSPMDSPVPAVAPAPARSPQAFPPPAPPAPAQAAGTPHAEQAPTASGTGKAATAGQASADAQRTRKQAEEKVDATAAMKAAGKPATPAAKERVGSLDAAAEADTRALDRIEVTGSRIKDFDDQPLDDQPPASADSPQVRQAWLQRVRQLIVQGKLDDARDSLREYQRRYPQAPLPDDLRALLVE